MLANALARFLEHSPALELARAIAVDRRRFVSHLRRLSHAVRARDTETAVRAMRELLSITAALILREADSVSAPM